MILNWNYRHTGDLFIESLILVTTGCMRNFKQLLFKAKITLKTADEKSTTQIHLNLVL